MKYEKRGSSVRWENGTVVRVTEQGVAIEEGATFTCMPAPGESLPPMDPAAVIAAADALVSAVPSPVRIERLVVSEGVAEHRIGATEWREQHRRVHLALVRGRERALLDFASFEHGVDDVVQALARCGEERSAPPRLRLAPAVTAALLPLLAGVAPPNIELRQADGGFDGRGLPISGTRIEGEPWPNWFRPSYRVRPARMPLNLRLECEVAEIDPERPVAIALLAPAVDLTLRLLVVDGAETFPATVRITRIDAARPGTVWYPYGGGAYGGEVML